MALAFSHQHDITFEQEWAPLLDRFPTTLPDKQQGRPIQGLTSKGRSGIS